MEADTTSMEDDSTSMEDDTTSMEATSVVFHKVLSGTSMEAIFTPVELKI